MGLDDAAAVELLSATGGNASEMEAHRARKAAREREGKKINAALQKLENVRLFIHLASRYKHSPIIIKPVGVRARG